MTQFITAAGVKFRKVASPTPPSGFASAPPRARPVMLGVMEGKIAPTLLSYSPREASTRCCASWISRLRGHGDSRHCRQVHRQEATIYRWDLRCVDFQGSGRLSGRRYGWMRKPQARQVIATTHGQE